MTTLELLLAALAVAVATFTWTSLKIREQANRIAAEIDAEPAGPWVLMELTHICMCGAPFDIEATPVFRARAEEAGIAWPPASPIHFPAKTY